MFWDTEFKLIRKNCIQLLAKPDLCEGLVVKPISQIKGVMENIMSWASCTAISSMPLLPAMHTCSRAYPHMHTHHMYSYTQLLNSLQFKFNTA